jgi:hypothetical protein
MRFYYIIIILFIYTCDRASSDGWQHQRQHQIGVSYCYTDMNLNTSTFGMCLNSSLMSVSA